MLARWLVQREPTGALEPKKPTPKNGPSDLMLQHPPMPHRALVRMKSSGPGRTRTDDRCGVNALLYQLSYRSAARTGP